MFYELINKSYNAEVKTISYHPASTDQGMPILFHLHILPSVLNSRHITSNKANSRHSISPVNIFLCISQTTRVIPQYQITNPRHLLFDKYFIICFCSLFGIQIRSIYYKLGDTSQVF